MNSSPRCCRRRISRPSQPNLHVSPSCTKIASVARAPGAFVGNSGGVAGSGGRRGCCCGRADVQFLLDRIDPCSQSLKPEPVDGGPRCVHEGSGFVSVRGRSRFEKK